MTTPASSYLDYNATAPLRPEVQDAMRAALEVYGNPSSVHGAGRKARALVEESRTRIAEVIGTAPGDITFTSGGTEANALALKGLAQAHGGAPVIAAGHEHASVLAHVPEADVIPCTASGVIDLAALEDKLKKLSKPAVVAVMLANNETGVLQPVADVVALARTYGALVHCDAVQVLGKIAIDFAALEVDSLSLSAHKAGGPKGIGALVVRRGLEVVAQLAGGGQERRRRAGTENVIGIAGFGAAARVVPDLLADVPRVRELRDALETQVRESASARIYGADAPRLANTSCIGISGVSSETQVMRLDLAGVMVSAGSACSSGKIAPSHVLLAMGVAPTEAKAAIRVSLGWASTAADLERFLAAWRPLALSAAA